MEDVIKRIDQVILQFAGEKSPRSYMGASGLGEPCDAKLWYSFKHPKQIEDARIHRIFALGHLLESYVISILKHAGYEVYTDDNGEQFGFKDEVIAGHIDGVIVIDGEAHLLEIKSANDKRFNTMKKEGIKKSDPIYYTQMMIYADKMDLKKIMFLAINKNTCEIYTEFFTPDTMESTYAISRGKQIAASETRPTRKYGHVSNFNCKMCNYRKDCWADADEA